jgi:hypothetical protein
LGIIPIPKNLLHKNEAFPLWTRRIISGIVGSKEDSTQFHLKLAKPSGGIIMTTKKESDLKGKTPDLTHLIRSLQRLEGNPDCFRKAGHHCEQQDCAWQHYCMEEPQDHTPQNDRVRYKSNERTHDEEDHDHVKDVDFVQ